MGLISHMFVCIYVRIIVCYRNFSVSLMTLRINCSTFQSKAANAFKINETVLQLATIASTQTNNNHFLAIIKIICVIIKK